jgi:hypothetical protein
MQNTRIVAVFALVLLVSAGVLYDRFSPRRRGRRALVSSLKRNRIETSVFPQALLENCVDDAYATARVMAKTRGARPFRDIFHNLVERDAIILAGIMNDITTADLNPKMRDRLKRHGIIY